MKNLTLDQKINSLLPGGSLTISSCNDITCIVERSGNGKNLIFSRIYKDGSFSVFKRCSF